MGHLNAPVPVSAAASQETNLGLLGLLLPGLHEAAKLGRVHDELDFLMPEDQFGRHVFGQQFPPHHAANNGLRLSIVPDDETLLRVR